MRMFPTSALSLRASQAVGALTVFVSLVTSTINPTPAFAAGNTAPTIVGDGGQYIVVSSALAGTGLGAVSATDAESDAISYTVANDAPVTLDAATG